MNSHVILSVTVTSYEQAYVWERYGGTASFPQTPPRRISSRTRMKR